MSITKTGVLFFCLLSFPLIGEEVSIELLEPRSKVVPDPVQLYSLPAVCHLEKVAGGFEFWDDAAIGIESVSDEPDWQVPAAALDQQEQQKPKRKKVSAGAVVNSSEQELSNSKFHGYMFRARQLIALSGLKGLLPSAQDRTGSGPGYLVMKELAYALINLRKTLQAKRNAIHSQRTVGHPEQLLRAIDKWVRDTYQPDQVIDLEKLRNYAGAQIDEIVSTVKLPPIKRPKKGDQTSSSSTPAERHNQSRREKTKMAKEILRTPKPAK